MSIEQHRPYVIPFVGITDGWVVRCDCGCGLKIEKDDKKQAEKVRDDYTLKD